MKQHVGCRGSGVLQKSAWRTHEDRIAIRKAIIIQTKVFDGLGSRIGIGVGFIRFVFAVIVQRERMAHIPVLHVGIIGAIQLNRRAHLLWSSPEAGLERIIALDSDRRGIE